MLASSNDDLITLLKLCNRLLIKNQANVVYNQGMLVKVRVNVLI